MDYVCYIFKGCMFEVVFVNGVYGFFFKVDDEKVVIVEEYLFEVIIVVYVGFGCFNFVGVNLIEVIYNFVFDFQYMVCFCGNMFWQGGEVMFQGGQFFIYQFVVLRIDGLLIVLGKMFGFKVCFGGFGGQGNVYFSSMFVQQSCLFVDYIVYEVLQVFWCVFKVELIGFYQWRSWIILFNFSQYFFVVVVEGFQYYGLCFVLIGDFILQ